MGLVHDIHSFFTELQGKDERTKKQWAIGLTSGSMVIVVGFWLLTLSSTLGSVSAPQASSQNQFLATMAAGFSVLKDNVSASIGTAMQKVQDSMGATNSVTLQPTGVTPADTEPLTVQKLP
ncbi:MAG: hypothetical protein KGI60_01610 [Patescibacteria group bacterium]|nr:hypothetical protein [Patescibacteria group bacterium]